MIVRYGIYEGSVAAENQAQFDRNMGDEVVPMLARMPGVLEVRLLRGIGVGALAPRYHQMIELSFADDAGLLMAMNSAERRDIGRVQAPSLDLFSGHTPHANFSVTRRLRGANVK
ncbi:MAG: hypothetical protein FJX35_01300 [Alphaproteobacteria bacterium]|nr:hypothetical protein [Alphaproteobacteria bacterium]